MKNLDLNEEFIIICHLKEDSKDLIEFGIQGEQQILSNMILLAMKNNFQFANLVIEATKNYEKINLPNLN
jgi:hypothetical protein